MQSLSAAATVMIAVLSLFATTVSFAVAYPKVAAIPVTVYYETLCSDSIHFINSKLVPAYAQADFASLLANLTLVPYGHVSVIDSGKYRYSCQHGQSECEGNKLHGCAVKYFKDKKKLLDYISCLLSISDVRRNLYMPYPVNECGDKIPKEIISKITNCYNSNEGWDIFNQNGVATDSLLGPNRFFVPYISFNNVKNDKVSDAANNDFRNTLCTMNSLRNYACTDYN